MVGEREFSRVVRSKFLDTEKYLNKMFIQREDAVHGLILGLLSRNHVFMLGPPGTGKTEMTSEFCSIIEDANFFEHLMMKSTTPDELFGVISVNKIRNEDKYERVTKDMLPESHIAFLDEFWRVGSGTGNGLLRMMDNTRMFQGARRPLISLIGASNCLPEDDSLKALYDRFALRFHVSGTRDSHVWKSILWDQPELPEKPSISLEDIRSAYRDILTVKISDETKEVAKKIREKLQGEGVDASLRRWCWALADRKRNNIPELSLVKCEAWLSGRDETSVEDLSVLRFMLWDNLNQKENVNSVILKYSAPAVVRYRAQLDDIVEKCTLFRHTVDSGGDVNKFDLNRVIRDAKKLEKEIKESLEKEGSSGVLLELNSIFNALLPFKAEMAAAVLGED